MSLLAFTDSGEVGGVVPNPIDLFSYSSDGNPQQNSNLYILRQICDPKHIMIKLSKIFQEFWGFENELDLDGAKLT